MTKIEVGELLYTVSMKITDVTEYGVSIMDVMNPEATLPPAGARFDIAVAGDAQGPKLDGTIQAVDYLHVRADRRAQLHIHGAITTSGGAKIAIFADGIATPEANDPSVNHLRENVSLHTNHPEFEWVNPLQIWGIGVVEMAKFEINITGYIA